MNNQKKLLCIIAIALIVVVSWLLTKNNFNLSNITKSDQQKWEDFKPILKNDANAFNNWVVKDNQVAEKHYLILKGINCANLPDFTNQNNCKILRDVTIKKIEKPEDLKKYDLYKTDEYKSILSSAMNF